MLLRVLIAVPRPLSGQLEPVLDGPDVVRTELGPDEDLIEAARGRAFDLVIADLGRLGESPAATVQDVRGLPSAPDVLVLSQSVASEVQARLLAAGAYAVLDTDAEGSTVGEALSALVERRRQRGALRVRAEEAERESRLADFASESPAMLEFLAFVRRVVDADSSLLVLGETGVGKEYLARAIHSESHRAAGPFIGVNCAALTESLLESELFGHVPGAFTGAVGTRRGYFELAHSGTLFLDEIGELPRHLQVKLLRVLQERSIQPVGGETLVPVDVRVVAATNRDLRADTAGGRFRSDLYYRLAVVSLEVPPLRRRREDIPGLVESHVQHFHVEMRRSAWTVRRDAMEMLAAYSWPGNVRELVNVVERAVLLCASSEITPADLPEEIRAVAPARADAPEASASTAGEADEEDLYGLFLRDAREALVGSFERRYVTRLLAETHGRVGAAAQRAGLSPRSLYALMQRHGLRKEDFKAARVER